jgi:hypothetical protein
MAPRRRMLTLPPMTFIPVAIFGRPPVHVQIEEVSSADGHVFSFPDGRTIRLTTDEKVAMVLICLLDATPAREATIDMLREQIVGSIAGDFLKAADELRQRIEKIQRR